MRALRFAARSLGRQRGRAVLGIVGVAAAGALMFDMLLLSRGLVVSLGQLLDALGYDVRVMAYAADADQESACRPAAPRTQDVETAAYRATRSVRAREQVSAI